MSIVTDGTAEVPLGTIVAEGAVRGRLSDARRWTPSFSLPPLNVCRDATLRRCRCSHFFAVPCFLFGAETVYSVFVAVMLAVFEGAARENVVR
jgi:hypothetical protein